MPALLVKVALQDCSFNCNTERKTDSSNTRCRHAVMSSNRNRNTSLDRVAQIQDLKESCFMVSTRKILVVIKSPPNSTKFTYRINRFLTILPSDAVVSIDPVFQHGESPRHTVLPSGSLQVGRQGRLTLGHCVLSCG
jgi:hypothetical protein